jgi:F-type H+-transporting ATPase subunit epsilon
MPKTFHFILSTPDAVLFDDEADYISVPTKNGEIGIMADHTPLVSLIIPGLMRIIKKDEEKILSTGGGFIKIKPGITKAYTQTAEFAESIDEKRAIEAQKEATKIMAEKSDRISLADATALLERNIARLKTIEHKKRRSDRKI